MNVIPSETKIFWKSKDQHKTALYGNVMLVWIRICIIHLNKEFNG